MNCRHCQHPLQHVFLDLGFAPPSNAYLSEAELGKPERYYPLKLFVCEHCWLVQTEDYAQADELFSPDYAYFSSYSTSWLEHIRRYVEQMVERFGLGPDSHVLELASNDGYLLKNYVERDIGVLGIDPATGPAETARRAGVPTLNLFFTREIARRLAAEGRRADVVHANNVLAHVADTNGFVAGLRMILKDDGVAVIEAPYVLPLVEHVEFDTIYHEHLCYFSVTALDRLFRRHGLYLNELKHLAIHGGSLRLYVEPVERVGTSVSGQLARERALGMDGIAFYRDLSSRVGTLKRDLAALLYRLKAEGKSIAAYGAAAKGATLVNHVGIGRDLVDFVVDRNIHKQGRHMPGQKIPILAPEALVERRPDYVLLLAWNFADEIMAQQQAYRDLGGRFIIPVPEPRIV